MNIELITDDKLEYNFYKNNTGFVQLRIKAPHDAHIALTTAAAEVEPIYKIVIGGWNNTKSVIRKNGKKVAKAATPGILDPKESRGFCIRWENRVVSVSRENEPSPFLSWKDHEQVNIEYIAVCTGWGANGSWVIQPPEARKQFAPVTGKASGGVPPQVGSVCWVPAHGGHVPPRSFHGGEDFREKLYVARAKFGGGLIPGKLLPTHGVCYVPWGGKENPVKEYEVLCDFHGDWIAVENGKIPRNALPAGQCEDGETLFIGRAAHDGTLTVGRVHGKNGVCYIAYGGKELPFHNYQILVESKSKI